jgi:hypothetical protein
MSVTISSTISLRTDRTTRANSPPAGSSSDSSQGSFTCAVTEVRGERRIIGLWSDDVLEGLVGSCGDLGNVVS